MAGIVKIEYIFYNKDRFGDEKMLI